MKSIITLLLVIIVSVVTSDGQDSIRIRAMTFKIKVDGPASKYRYLSAFSDSGIYFSAVPVLFSPNAPITNINSRIEYEKLNEIFVKRKGNAGRGFVKGAAIGAALGILGGLASGTDKQCSNTVGSIGGVPVCIASSTSTEKAVGGGIFFGLTGGFFGTLAGALTGRSFLIGGDREKFNALRNHFTKKTVRMKRRKS